MISKPYSEKAAPPPKPNTRLAELTRSTSTSTTHQEPHSTYIKPDSNPFRSHSPIHPPPPHKNPIPKQPTMPTPTPLQTKISNHLTTYLTAFNTSNFTTASKYYHTPSIAISATGVTILPSPTEISTLLSTTVDRLKKTNGFDHSEWIGEKTIIVLEDDDGGGDNDGGERGLVMASCGCKRVRKDGSVCEVFTATYTLRKVEGEWLIVSVHQHPLSTQLK